MIGSGRKATAIDADRVSLLFFFFLGIKIRQKWNVDDDDDDDTGSTGSTTSGASDPLDASAMGSGALFFLCVLYFLSFFFFFTSSLFLCCWERGVRCLGQVFAHCLVTEFFGYRVFLDWRRGVASSYRVFFSHSLRPTIRKFCFFFRSTGRNRCQKKIDFFSSKSCSFS